MTKNSEDKYSDKETEKRMVAALRGARLVGHMPMKPLPDKRAKKAKKKR